MFQIVKVKEGWQVRGSMPIAEQMRTYGSRRKAVDIASAFGKQWCGNAIPEPTDEERAAIMRRLEELR